MSNSIFLIRRIQDLLDKNKHSENFYTHATDLVDEYDELKSYFKQQAILRGKFSLELMALLRYVGVETANSDGTVTVLKRALLQLIDSFKYHDCSELLAQSLDQDAQNIKEYKSILRVHPIPHKIEHLLRVQMGLIENRMGEATGLINLHQSEI
tara:strand:- start:1300 stop:1761 length:462 start_codon:yes stop_codon:yes gene_type:complete